MNCKMLYVSLFFVLFIPATAQANDYTITYTINIHNDGNAVWYVEYRTPLASKADFDSFDNYTMQLNAVYLKEFKELMQKSVLEAANATSRRMVAGGFTGNASVQSAPTGEYGVVRYSFTWTNFAKLDPDNRIDIGDVFVGGLYLPKDNTLIIQYPEGYTVERVAPQPDRLSDGMLWYGLHSFKAGEPRITLLGSPSNWSPIIIMFLISGIITAGVFIYLQIRRRNAAVTEDSAGDSTDNITAGITETEMMDLEDRIVKLLKESGGSLFQSEIGRRLDLPRSTVSSALNQLHNKNIIQKIKKGRENLIRLV